MNVPNMPVILCDRHSLDDINQTAVALDLRNVNTASLEKIAALNGSVHVSTEMRQTYSSATKYWHIQSACRHKSAKEDKSVPTIPALSQASHPFTRRHLSVFLCLNRSKIYPIRLLISRAVTSASRQGTAKNAGSA